MKPIEAIWGIKLGIASKVQKVLDIKSCFGTVWKWGATSVLHFHHGRIQDFFHDIQNFWLASLKSQNFFITLHVSINSFWEPSVKAIKTKDFFIRIQNSTSVTIFGMSKYSEDWRKKMGKRRDLLVIQCITKKERKKFLLYHEASWGGIDKS